MADPFSGATGTTKQELAILDEADRRSKVKGQHIDVKKRRNSRKKSEDEGEVKEVENASSLYEAGIKLLELIGYRVELDPAGPHVFHSIMKPSDPPSIEGIRYPSYFSPVREMHKQEDFDSLRRAFQSDACSAEVRSFWEPLYNPKVGETPLSCFTRRRLSMLQIENTMNIHEVLEFGHSFDPAGRWSGIQAHNPKIWVPDEDWFDPRIRQLKFSDVFTIFPKAERELLKLILGRVGVGRSNHRPPGWDHPISHTARMAAVIVGKDPGLGKSTLFNGMTAALSKCGFVTRTFRSVDDRFGLKAAALSNICYKDDTSLSSLKKLLSSESTKILVTNGLFETEEKFESLEQIQPRTVIIVNANDWNSKFAYDLDPGIIDRIKIISTCREFEVKELSKSLRGSGSISEDSPDLRPHGHLPYLAEKLGVSQDAIYLWCLRIATNRFWEVISDNSDPTINKLQMEVRYWTTRQRIKFKADVIQSIVNSMAFSKAIKFLADRWENGEIVMRGGDNCEEFWKADFMPELNASILHYFLRDLYFVAVDPSCQPLTQMMKERWEEMGRPSTHYYEGFRELRWESVKVAITELGTKLFNEDSQKIYTRDNTSGKVIKDAIETLSLRDGFKMGGEASYVTESWNNCRLTQPDFLKEAKRLLEKMEDRDIDRLKKANSDEGRRIVCYDDWILKLGYSPDSAERLRTAARNVIYKENQG